MGPTHSGAGSEDDRKNERGREKEDRQVMGDGESVGWNCKNGDDDKESARQCTERHYTASTTGSMHGWEIMHRISTMHPHHP